MIKVIEIDIEKDIDINSYSYQNVGIGGWLFQAKGNVLIHTAFSRFIIRSTKIVFCFLGHRQQVCITFSDVHTLSINTTAVLFNSG